MNKIVPNAAQTWQKIPIVGLRRHFATRQNGLGILAMRRENDADGSTDMAALLHMVSTKRDIGAFETIFRHFAPRVKAYMARLSADSQMAEELMQETMIAVWNKADQFDPSKGALSTWIFTIARNHRIDAFRREKRPEFDPNDPAFVPDDVVQADAGIEARQASQLLHDAIAKLPEEQTTILKMSFFEDNSHSTIAEKLNLPLGTVKSRMRLAFEKLRGALGQSGEAS